MEGFFRGVRRDFCGGESGPFLYVRLLYLFLTVQFLLTNSALARPPLSPVPSHSESGLCQKKQNPFQKIIAATGDAEKALIPYSSHLRQLPESLDVAQVVKYDDLFDRYSCKKLIQDPVLNELLDRVFDPYRRAVNKKLNTQYKESGATYFEVIHDQSVRARLDSHLDDDSPSLLPKIEILDFQKSYDRVDRKAPGWSQHWKQRGESFSGRSEILQNDQIPGWFFKKFGGEGNNSSMANTLRIPMAVKLSHLQEELKLDHIEIPKKCLVPLLDKDQVDKLDENSAGYGFMPVVQKLDLMEEKEGLQYLARLPARKQREMAEEIATLISHTGLWDISLSNLGVTRAGKIAFIDTEPLRGELVLDQELPASLSATRKKYYIRGTAKSYKFRKANTLRSSAIQGLGNFKESAKAAHLDTFLQVADEWIKQLSAAKSPH